MLFVHCKGDRRDKYLYGGLLPFFVTQRNRLNIFSPGRKDVRYRSAAEFMPHAEWLYTTEQPARTCGCRYCPRDKSDKRSVPKGKGSHHEGKLQRPKPRPLPENLSRARRPAQPIPRISSRAGRGSHSKPLSVTSTSKDRTGSSPDLLPSHGAKKVLGCVRVAVPKGSYSNGGTILTIASWPTMHELVWCKLEHSVIWIDAIIEFWPGIIKESPKGPEGYLVTLLGNTRDIHVSLHAMLPYQSYQVEEAMLHKLQSAGRRRARTTLLDLEEYSRVEMDDSRFSSISSAFSFAISFSVHLATVWSWAVNPETGSSVPPSSISRPVAYHLRSQKHTEKQYSILWWGPERIEIQQMVRLKMSTSAISIDPDVLTTPVLASYPTELDEPTFLQIHSISYRQKSQKTGDRLTGPVVAGAIFDLVDENPSGTRSCCGPKHCSSLSLGLDKGRYENLPSPPLGKVFRPWLKENYEIVLPVTVIGNRYHRGTAEEGISKHAQTSLTSMECVKRNSIKPITFQPTRAKMLECAYRKAMITWCGTRIHRGFRRVFANDFCQRKGPEKGSAIFCHFSGPHTSTW